MTEYPKLIDRNSASGSRSKMNSKAGNYQLKSGRTEWFDSKAEATIAQEMESKGIPFHRIRTNEKPAPVTVVKTSSRYPDFWLETNLGPTLIEVKGYLGRSERKARLKETTYEAKRQGYAIGVLFTGDSRALKEQREISAYPYTAREAYRMKKALQKQGVPMEDNLDKLLKKMGVSRIYDVSGKPDPKQPTVPETYWEKRLKD